MQMKKFINDPDNLTAELLEGLALANPDILELGEDNTVSYTHLDVYKRQTYSSAIKHCAPGNLPHGNKYRPSAARKTAQRRLRQRNRRARAARLSAPSGQNRVLHFAARRAILAGVPGHRA